MLLLFLCEIAEFSSMVVWRAILVYKIEVKKKCLYVLFYLAISRTFISFFLIFNSVISKSFEDVIIFISVFNTSMPPPGTCKNFFNGLKSIFQYLFYLLWFISFWQNSSSIQLREWIYVFVSNFSTLKKGIKI